MANENVPKISFGQTDTDEKMEEIAISMSNIRTEHSQRSEYNLAGTMRKVRRQRELHRKCAQNYERLNSLINFLVARIREMRDLPPNLLPSNPFVLIT